MLKFIKMKYHGAYLLYYSVLSVVIVVFTMIENFSANWGQRWKKMRIAQVCTFFHVWNFWSALVKTKTRKSCSRFEIKWQSIWFRHSFLNQLIWFCLERLYSFKKIKLNKNEKEVKQERSLIPKSNRFVGD